MKTRNKRGCPNSNCSFPRSSSIPRKLDITVKWSSLSHPLPSTFTYPIRGGNDAECKCNE